MTYAELRSHLRRLADEFGDDVDKLDVVTMLDSLRNRVNHEGLS